MLATPLNVSILRALDAGPKQQAELIRATGVPAQTTLRAQLKRLVSIGAIDKHRRNRFPGALEYELTAAGGDLLLVANVLERWLGSAPEGPLHLDGNAAKAAIKALAEAWSTTMLRALASGPLSLTELDRVIGALSYPSLERRLSAMRLAGQVEACSGNGRGTPYAVTRWLRWGVAPLVTAARWERRHAPHATTAPSRLDAEAAFLLATPLLRPATDLHGECRLAVAFPSGQKQRLAGVIVGVDGGMIESCTTNLDGTADAWALGTTIAWLDAVIEGRTGGLELGGELSLAHALLDSLHEALGGTDRQPALDSNRVIREDGTN